MKDRNASPQSCQDNRQHFELMMLCISPSTRHDLIRCDTQSLPNRGETKQLSNAYTSSCPTSKVPYVFTGASCDRFFPYFKINFSTVFGVVPTAKTKHLRGARDGRERRKTNLSAENGRITPNTKTN